MSIPHRVMRSVAFGGVMLFTAICLHRTGDAFSQAVPESGNYSGQVINSITGQPIARALVQLGGAHAALTDHEGRFEFTNVPEGDGAVFATKPGFFVPEDQGLPASHSSMTLKLIPEALLSGTVSDADGQPVQELEVHLKKFEVRDGLSRWQRMQSTTTNAEGEFRFAELQAGKYALSTGYKVDGLPQATSSAAFVPVDYPPSAGNAVDSAITLAPGERAEANMNSAAVRLYPVIGQVTGRFNQGVSFTFETMEGEPISPAMRFFAAGGLRGAFRAMLPSGRYRFRANSSVASEQYFAAGEVTVGEAPLNGVTIHLEPQITLPTQVDYQSTGTDTQTATGTPFLNLMLQEEDPSGGTRDYPALPLPVRGAAPDPRGPLFFQNIEPGTYALRPQLAPPWYVASASCGNVDLDREPLVLAAGSAPCVMRVILRDDCGSLKMNVTGADTQRPDFRGFITAIPLGSSIQPVQDMGLSGQGAFDTSFACLAPGRYLVVALENRQELPYRDEKAMKPYLALGQEVTVPRGGKADVQLKVFAGKP